MSVPHLYPPIGKSQSTYSLSKESVCLTDEQTEYVYSQVENDKVISSEDFCTKYPFSIKDCINTTNNMTHVHEYEKNPYESLWLNDYESHDVNRSLLEFE